MRTLWYWPFARSTEMALAQKYAALGHDLTVQVINRDAAPQNGDADGFTLRRTLSDIDRSRRGFRWPLSRARTYRRRFVERRDLIASTAPDLVHFHYVNRFTDWAFRADVPWVLSVHDVDPHQPRLGALERPLLKRLYARPDQLVVHHQWLAERLQDRYDLPPDRVSVVPLQALPVPEPTRRQPSDRPMILCFGALRPNKNIEGLIDAMDHSEMQDFVLHIAGRGDAQQERRLQSLAERKPNVTLELGFISEDRKAELFRQSAVVALPYRTFNSVSAVLTDAYGHGRPVVATDVGALGPSVSDEETGQLVSGHDPNELAGALREMAGPGGDQAAANALAMTAQHQPGAIAGKLDEVYRSLVS